MLGGCGKQNNDPHLPSTQDVPGTCEYTTLHGKREYADMIKDLEMKNLGLSKWTQSNHMNP